MAWRRWWWCMAAAVPAAAAAGLAAAHSEAWAAALTTAVTVLGAWFPPRWLGPSRWPVGTPSCKRCVCASGVRLRNAHRAGNSREVRNSHERWSEA